MIICHKDFIKMSLSIHSLMKFCKGYRNSHMQSQICVEPETYRIANLVAHCLAKWATKDNRNLNVSECETLSTNIAIHLCLLVHNNQYRLFPNTSMMAPI